MSDASGTPKRFVLTTLSSELRFDDSALQPDHRGVGSVVGAQFGEDVPDLALDGLFADRELSRNYLVGIARGNQIKDADFRRGQSVIGGVFGELEGCLWGHCLFPGMNRPDRVEQFLVQAIL